MPIMFAPFGRPTRKAMLFARGILAALGCYLNYKERNKMAHFSIWHWLILLSYVAIIVVPCWRIVSKAGYSGAWSLLALIPLVNLIALWVFAFVTWPSGKTAS
jgi:hypothetical protein